MSNGNDSKYRSRKWILAGSSLILATIAATILESAFLALVWKKIIGEEVWKDASIGVLYWWLFVDATVLSGYGIANVIEKWAPRSG